MNTILVIDDDDQLRISFCKLLREENYSVMGAASGEAGVDMVKQQSLDLVILDMRLPGMDGMETFTQIKKMDPKLPVIIVTAYGTTETAIEATKMGAYDYVLKPFEIPEMLNLITQAIDAGYFMKSPVAWTLCLISSPVMPLSARAGPCRQCTKPSAGWPRPMPPSWSGESLAPARN